MNVDFSDKKLEELETSDESSGDYPAEVVKAFRKRMQFIRAAADERDLYQMKSLRFKKLKGDRSDERSMRLNDQWRLILRLQAGTPTNTAVILAIEDYH